MTTISTKHAVVTGAASGIGRLVAAKMAGLGASVTLVDLDEPGLLRAESELCAAGADVHTAVCDLGDRAAVAAAADEITAAAGPVDILVNNAGVVSGRLLLDLTDEQIERTFRVNTLALFWTTRAFLPGMIERGFGHIATVASAAGLVGTCRETDYAASKHAAIGFNEALRMELRRLAPGVHTTIVCPYYIDTGMFAGVRTRIPLLLPILKEEQVAERIVRAVQLNRPQVQMPWMVRTLPLTRLLPVAAFDRVADLLGLNACMNEFSGRGPAPSCDAVPQVQEVPS
jgi:all-trans-retinol dehydrogenase (NAD+)